MMKRHKKIYSSIIAISLILSVFTSCGSSSNKSENATNDSYDSSFSPETSMAEKNDYIASADEDIPYPENDETGITKKEPSKSEVIDSDIDTDEEVESNNNKIIYTYDITLETREFEKSRDALYETIAKTKSYVEASKSTSPKMKIQPHEFTHISQYSEELNYGYSTNNTLYMVVRVPSKNLDDFIKSTSGIAHVVSEELTSENVSLKYVDMEARKDTIKQQEETLNRLLEKAASTDEIIKLVERISNLTAERESLERQLRTLDNQVEYSIVNISLVEVGEYKEPTVVEPPTFRTRVARAFRRSVRSVKNFVEDIVVWLVGNIIFLIPLCLILFFLIRYLFKKNKSRKERLKKEKEASKQKKIDGESDVLDKEDDKEKENDKGKEKENDKYIYDPEKPEEPEK